MMSAFQSKHLSVLENVGKSRYCVKFHFIFGFCDDKLQLNDKSEATLFGKK